MTRRKPLPEDLLVSRLREALERIELAVSVAPRTIEDARAVVEACAALRGYALQLERRTRMETAKRIRDEKPGTSVSSRWESLVALAEAEAGNDEVAWRLLLPIVEWQGDGDLFALGALVDSFSRLGRFSDALPWSRLWARAEPSNKLAQFRFGMCLAHLGFHEEAGEVGARLIELAAGGRSVCFGKWILRQLRQHPSEGIPGAEQSRSSVGRE